MGRVVGGTGGALTLCPAEFTPQGAIHLLQVAATYHFIFPLHHRTTLARMDPGTSRAAPGALLTRSNPPSILWQLFPTPEPGRGGKASCSRPITSLPPSLPQGSLPGCHIGIFIRGGS